MYEERSVAPVNMVYKVDFAGFYVPVVLWL